MAPHIYAVATLTLGAVVLPVGGEPPAAPTLIHATPPKNRADLMQILIRLQSRLARKRHQAAA